MSKHSPRFAVCINNFDYPASLERHKIYQVIPDPSIEGDGELVLLMRVERIISILLVTL